MKRIFLMILVCLVCAPALRAQTVDDDDVVRVETDVTNLPFTAMDKQRRFVTTLRAEDVRVLEDGVPQLLHVSARNGSAARNRISDRRQSIAGVHACG